MYQIAVIGSGHRATPLVKRLCEKEGFVLKAVCDIDLPAVQERYKDYDGVEYFTDAETMLESCHIDGIFVGTRCSLHTRFALLCHKYNIPLFLEKPVSINEEQLKALEKIVDYNDRVVVSFPLRLTHIVKCVKEIVDSGKLGRVAHVQAYNNVPYARGYYHGWYRDENETGGLFLQKTTHDFDYINYLLGNLKPVRIAAMESKQIFKGDMPEGLACADCPRQEECPESRKNVESYGDPYEIRPWCAFAKDTGNHDSGSTMVMYENGVHVVYSQNFIARKKAAKRGARLIGYYGTVEFDFNTGIVNVYYHNENRTETHTFDVGSGHSGGDKELIDNFADVIRGKDVSHSDLKSGILSAKMCLAAKRSAADSKFYDL